jgi:enoyl-CoA hydratase/carnithine racemase
MSPARPPEGAQRRSPEGEGDGVSSKGEVRHTIDGHVATVTLRNTGRYNAMSMGMWRALAQTMEWLQENETVRAVVLRGDGDKAFVSGADISEFGVQRSGHAAVQAYDAAVRAAQDGITHFPQPVIAAISGICYGGGLGLALACDLRYCAPNARFRMPAGRLGLGYAHGGIKRMVDVLGAARAAELFYTAQVFDAPQAATMGLVNAVPDEVFGRAHAVAADIASNAPLTLAAAKLAFGAVLAGSPPDQVAAVDAAVQACFTSSDYMEGRNAFAEKRPPRFTGR